MKKATIFILIALLVISPLTICACKPAADYTVAVMQVATHSALDAAREGFEDTLSKWAASQGKTINFDEYNAQGDKNNEITLANTIVNSSPDLILGIATSTAQALAGATTKIPVLYTAVTAPVESGLTGENVTGTSDLNPVAEQIELIRAINPSANKIAFLYNSGEINSQIQVNLAKAKAEQLGMETVEITATSSSDIQTALEGAIFSENPDALYIPTDNLIASNMPIVYAATVPEGIPVICGEEAMCEDGKGLATFGIDYYELGVQTAEMAIKILSGEKTAAQLPFEYYQRDCVFFINETTATALGMLPDAVDALKTRFE